MAHNYNNLQIWKKAMVLAKRIYVFTGAIEKQEKYGLVSQMRRAAVSIPSNIAEGSKRTTSKDFKQFLNIASGSVAELATQLQLVHDIYAIDVSEYIGEAHELERMIHSFSSQLR